MGPKKLLNNDDHNSSQQPDTTTTSSSNLRLQSSFSSPEVATNLKVEHNQKQKQLRYERNQENSSSKKQLQQHQHHQQQQRVEWSIAHETTCLSRNQLSASLIDVFSVMDNENKDLVFSEDDLPTRADVVIVPSSSSFGNSRSILNDGKNEALLKLVEIYKNYVKDQGDDVESKQKQIPESSLATVPATNSKTSWAYRLTSSVVRTGFEYVVKTPAKMALDSIIGTSDYSSLEPPLHTSQSTLLEASVYDTAKTPPTRRLVNFEEHQDTQSVLHLHNNQRQRSTLSDVISEKDQVVCTDILVRALECVHQYILHATPTILSDNVKANDGNGNPTSDLRDWIRTNLRSFQTETIVTTKPITKDAVNSLSHINHKRIAQLVCELQDSDLDLLISCLLELSQSPNVSSSSQTKNILKRIDRDDGCLWVIGHDQITPVDVRVALYDLDHAHQNIIRNINLWQNNVDRCTLEARRYKSLMDSSIGKKHQQELQQLVRTKVAKVLHLRKTYMARIETAQHLVLQVEQQQLSLESSMHDQSCVAAMQKTSETLRHLRLQQPDHLIQQQHEQASNNDSIVWSFENDDISLDDLNELDSMAESYSLKKQDRIIVSTATNLIKQKEEEDDDFDINDYVDADSIEDDVLLSQLKTLSIFPQRNESISHLRLKGEKNNAQSNSKIVKTTQDLTSKSSSKSLVVEKSKKRELIPVSIH